MTLNTKLIFCYIAKHIANSDEQSNEVNEHYVLAKRAIR